MTGTQAQKENLLTERQQSPAESQTTFQRAQEPKQPHGIFRVIEMKP
jgi:hypothetical protein